MCFRSLIHQQRHLHFFFPLLLLLRLLLLPPLNLCHALESTLVTVAQLMHHKSLVAGVLLLWGLGLRSLGVLHTHICLVRV